MGGRGDGFAKQPSRRLKGVQGCIFIMVFISSCLALSSTDWGVFYEYKSGVFWNSFIDLFFGE
jgi:hypothetical protein